MTRFLKFTLVWLAVAVVGYFGWTTLGQTSLLNKPSKTALSQMHHSLQVGDSKPRVDQVFQQFKTDRTALSIKVFEDTWVMTMPFEFGAGDWVLYVQFDRSEKVSAVVMRTSDGIYSRLAGDSRG
jgi:hypothetical protein